MEGYSSNYVISTVGQNFSLTHNKKKGKFLAIFKKWSCITIVLSGILQCIFFPSLEMLFAVSIVLLSWFITINYLFRPVILFRFTLSAFLIIGFSLTQYFLPIVFTLLEGKPLTYNLSLPYEVFTHSILALIILIFSHYLYTRHFKWLNTNCKKKIQNTLAQTKIYTTPLDKEIWAMGIIGLIAMFVVYFYSKQSYENISEGIGNKILEGLMPFAYAPYFIPLKKLYGKKSFLSKSLTLNLVVFTLFIIIIGVAGNSRGLFMTGITTVGIGYFLGLLLGKFAYKIISHKHIFFFFIAFWIITGPLSDIGTAMVMVRSNRGSIPKREMISQTIETFKDKNAIYRYRAQITKDRNDWDERYFDNIFLARFCNLKYNDASLELANRIGKIDPQMYRYTMDRFWAILPQPLLDQIPVFVDKKSVASVSFGDYLYYRAGADASVLGGFRTGQFAGTGMTSFGWWYLLILGIGVVPVFFLLDLFVLTIYNYKNKSGSTIISLAGLLPITSIFMFLSLSTPSESVINLYTYILRGWPQSIILYLTLYFLVKILSKKRLLKRNQRFIAGKKIVIQK
ncbi:MAG: hypothetical protein JSS98_03245 [Bacteroidetes bacterium]|nr:hypothetical protein [Bacteroidota bacterium]MBS1735601.1 hypothetical protein [Bacteroidota bacterium]